MTAAGDEIPDDVIAGAVFAALVDAIAHVGWEAAASPFTVVGLIVVDSLPGVMDGGEYWPDAHEVTFTEPEPEPVPEPARERLQDWIDRAGALLEEDR